MQVIINTKEEDKTNIFITLSSTFILIAEGKELSNISNKNVLEVCKTIQYLEK